MLCQQCHITFKPRRPGGGYKFCSHDCYWRSLKGRIAPNKGVKQPQTSGIANHNWKEVASYSAVHYWLRRHYGHADHCENSDCENRSKRFEWALIAGTSYTKDRNNFKQLCSVCHHAYDRIADKRWGRFV